ncbi:MAG: hypothetical protein AB7N54_19575 [Alphaproteobacteria bacterium]
MAPVSDQLRAVGIVLRRHEPGTRKTTCPQCSHLRRKRAEACLSVTIEPGHAVWHCHNCGWSGGIKEHGNGPERNGRSMGKGPRHQRIDLGAAERRQRYGSHAS